VTCRDAILLLQPPLVLLLRLLHAHHCGLEVPHVRRSGTALRGGSDQLRVEGALLPWKPRGHGNGGGSCPRKKEEKGKTPQKLLDFCKPLQ